MRKDNEMKNKILLSVILGSLLGTVAMADTSPSPNAVSLSANAAPNCSFGAFGANGNLINSNYSAATASANGQANSANLTFPNTGGNSFIGANGAYNDTGISFNAVMTGYCNYAHFAKLTSSSNGLRPPIANMPVGTSAGSFATILNYEAILKWGPSAASWVDLLTTGVGTASADGGHVNGAYAGNATLSVTLTGTNNPTKPMVAGTWTDVLTVQIGVPF